MPFKLEIFDPIRSSGNLAAAFIFEHCGATRATDQDENARLLAIMTGKPSDGIANASQRIMTRNFVRDQAAIDAYLDGHYVVRDAFVAARVAHLTADVFIAHLERTKALGGGGKDVAALFETLLAGGPEG